MDEIAWNKYIEDSIKAKRLFLDVQELMECYPEKMRISKAVLIGLITPDEAKLIRRFYT